MKFATRAALLAATALVPAAAHAQDTPPAGASQTGNNDIVITARKTEESLLDSPVTVSVVSDQQIRDLGLNSIDDFARQATGISFSQAFGRSSDRPVIRGQSNVLANVQFGVETGAAYFVDGIYYQGDIQGFDPESLQRVEIIKGPQSALYGRNTYAGAINFITKDPSERLTVSGRATAAQYNEFQFIGTVSGPIIPDVLGFRLGGRFYTYGGQYRNQLTGRRVGSEETASAYLLLNFTPGDDLKIRLRAQYQRDDDGPLAIFLQGSEANNCLPGFRSNRYRTASIFLPYVPNALGPSTNTNQYYCGVIQPQPNNVRLNTDVTTGVYPAITSFVPGVPSFPGATFTGDGTAFDGVRNDQFYLSSIIDWDIAGSGFVLSSLTGYRDNTNLFGTDSDHSNAFFFFAAPTAGTEPAFANTNRNDTWDLSQEIRLMTPARYPVRALVGAYYFKQVDRGTDITFASGTGGTAFGALGSSLNEIESVAVFGSLTWDITDRLSISGEIRYAEERKRQLDFSAAPIFCAGFAGVTNAFGTFTNANCNSRYLETGTDPRITINYTTPGGTLFYAVYATGRKPGGFNGAAGVTAATQYPGSNFVNYLPEKSVNYEVGVKFEALERRLRVSFAAYTATLTDVQLTTAIPNPAGTGAITSIVTNSGNARSNGFELDVDIIPADWWTFRFGVSYTDARFTRGCDADQFIFNSGGLRPNFDTRNPTAAALPLCNITGNRLALGSPWMINGSTTLTQPLSADMSFWANANFSYEDSKYVQVHNRAETGDTFLLNARIGIRTENFTLALFGRNLTNESSIPLATRWFDFRYGNGTTGLPAAATVTFDGRPAVIESGGPRAFFATLRKGRTFGVEGTFNF